MPPFYIIRKSSNIAVGMTRDDPSGNIDSSLFLVADNPVTPNGPGLQPRKILVGNTLRNATAAEISTGVQKETDDNDGEKRKRSKENIDNNELFKAIAVVLSDIASNPKARTVIQIRTALKAAIDAKT